jgi:hypothetical protein
MADPVSGFVENTNEVKRLLTLHEEQTGKAPGRRYGVEVLNKSSVVLLTACWEAFVEDTASGAFEFILEKTPDPSKLPKEVMKRVAKWIREDKHELKPWELAADGWRKVLKDYKQTMLHTHVSFFNTPKAGNVDALFRELLDYKGMSSNWTWNKMTADKARERLGKYIELRGAIAHRVKSSQSVHKKTVRDYSKFVTRLAVRTANVTRKHVRTLVGHYPWDAYKYGSFE